MIANLSQIDKVSIVALAQEISKETGTSTIAGVAKKLGVPLMTEHRNRQQLVQQLNSQKHAQRRHDLTDALKLAKTLISSLMSRCLASQDNNNRSSYAPWFKELICQQLEESSSKNISNLTGISVETLKKFTSPSLVLTQQPLSDDHTFILSAWNQASVRQRKNLNNFWMSLGRRFPDRKISYAQVRQTLIDLGLRYPRGPKSKNEGTQVKTRWEPHSLWEGDGKLMNIRVKGANYQFCWYCFIDQNSTLLVGSSIGPTESAETFLAALKKGRDQVGFYAVGILIDNRLGKGQDIDLSTVRSFCADQGIILAHTFPGNAKSNGIIEGNFSIFEKYVGDIEITGQTEEEIARSIALLISEIFTQQRNHSSRKRLGGNSPSEKTGGAPRPEQRRGAIERLQNRFEKEEKNIEQKWSLVQDLLPFFGSLSPESIAKFKAQLDKYPVLDIIAGKASYLAQQRKHPEKRYGSEYFLAIVRNKQEQQCKQIYNETFRAGMEQLGQVLPTRHTPDFILIPKLTDFFKSLVEQPSPSHIMLHLDSLAWWLVKYNQAYSLSSLWGLLERSIESSIGISLKSWSSFKEYLVRRIGPLIYEKSHGIVPRSMQANY